MVRCLTFVFAALVLSAAAVAQQPAIVPADLTRLEASASDIERQATVLRRTDAALAADVTKSLSELRDELTYLRVKLRRDGAVSRAEYNDVKDRLETLRIKAGVPAAGQQVSAQPVLPSGGGTGAERAFTLPVGTELDIRLSAPLSSNTAKVEQRFEGTTIVDTLRGADLVVPGGSVVRGFVSSVRAAGKVDRQGSLTLSFDEIVIDRRPSKLRASVVKALDPKVTEDVSRIGVGAAVGAIIGGVLGGGKGALVGVLVGGGGTIASTEGSDVTLPAGNVLRIRLDQPLEVIR